MTDLIQSANAEIKEVIDRYREARTRIPLLSLFLIASEVRAVLPEAHSLVFEYSDQGPYLTFSGVIDPTSDEDDHFVAAEDYEGEWDEVDGMAGNLDTDGWEGAWEAWAENAEVAGFSRNFGYVMQIDPILFDIEPTITDPKEKLTFTRV